MTASAAPIPGRARAFAAWSTASTRSAGACMSPAHQSRGRDCARPCRLTSSGRGTARRSRSRNAATPTRVHSASASLGAAAGESAARRWSARWALPSREALTGSAHRVKRHDRRGPRHQETTMPKYLLLKHYRRGPEPHRPVPSIDQWAPEDVQAHMAFQNHVSELREENGEYVDAQALTPAPTCVLYGAPRHLGVKQPALERETRGAIVRSCSTRLHITCAGFGAP